jgi:hypothetical protein
VGQLPLALFHLPSEGYSSVIEGIISLASAPAKSPPHIILELHNEAGHLTIAYKLYRCWVSAYLAMLDLDATANAVAI